MVLRVDGSGSERFMFVRLYVSKRQQAHFVDIERLMKSFKTHRRALDFDSGFISS